MINIHGREVASITIHFLMRRWNHRRDEYGGSFENRARFWRETIELVREAVGDRCAIAVGMCVDSLHDGDEGIRAEVEAARFIEHADHLVDLWDLQVGGRTVHEWTDDAAPSRMRAEGWQSPWIAKVRAFATKPIAGVGRFTSPALDVIGAARPSISDPFLPQKIDQGRLDEIRECIGCNACVGRVNLGTPIVCTQNATMGEEYRRGWHPERFTRARNAASDVLVVGAGPAGMECARVLGERGVRRVHLVDGDREMGGLMRWVPRLPGLGEWARVVSYRQGAIARLANVDFIPATRLSPDDCLEYGADIVICATGSHWATDGRDPRTHEAIAGADATLPYVLTPEQIMIDGKRPPGERVLVYDCDGYFVGMSIAEHLALDGLRVVYVTPLDVAGSYMFYTGEGAHMNRRLRELGVEVVPSHGVSEVRAGSAVGAGTYAPQRPVSWSVDGIVLVTQRISDDGLYRELAGSERLAAEGIAAVYRTGDCIHPRQLAEVIFDGHRLAREIDSPDPATPLPFIREYLVVAP